MRERLKNSQQECEVLKNERKTGKVLNKNVRLSRNVRERLKNSQQEREILTNVRFSRMCVCVCVCVRERERERGNFFSPRILCNSECLQGITKEKFLQ